MTTTPILKVTLRNDGRDLRVSQRSRNLVVYDHAAPDIALLTVTIPEEWQGGWAWNVSPDLSDEEFILLIKSL